MRIAILSDLHLESRDQATIGRLPPVNADVLILAGDIMGLGNIESANNNLKRFTQKYANRKIVYVLGPHEFYGSSPEVVERNCKLLQERYPEVDVCFEPKAIEHMGKKIVAATLWFSDTADAKKYKGHMDDFKSIANFEPWVYEQNKKHVEFFKENLSPGCVMVTHHLPTQRAVPMKFSYSPLNRFIVHDIEDIIMDKKVGLSIFGHYHSFFNQRARNTRFISNPMGNERENTGFNPELVIEV